MFNIIIPGNEIILAYDLIFNFYPLNDSDVWREIVSSSFLFRKKYSD